MVYQNKISGLPLHGSRLFDKYVRRGIDWRGFLEGATKFAAVNYPGTRQGFDNDTSPRFAAKAAKAARQRVARLRRLGPERSAYAVAQATSLRRLTLPRR